MIDWKRPLTVGVGVFVAASLWAGTGTAFFLDEDRQLKFTGAFYTQSRMAISDTEPPEVIRGGGITPEGATKAGQLIQWRNFANPVFEGQLAKLLGLTFIEDLSFRFAGRFVYDGVYDFGTSQFARQSRLYRASSRFISENLPTGNRLGGLRPATIFQGTKRVELNDSTGPCGDPSNPPFFSATCQIANADQRNARDRDMDLQDPRHDFGTEVEPWEIYMNIQRGPIFFRIGRQNLSWGEADGRRLLDVINPTNLFFGLPFDEDLDEQRIPLWMVRGNVQVIDTLGPLSSVGLEGFWVPGVIDTTQGPFNISGNHPYGPPTGCDPQLLADSEAVKNTSSAASDPPTPGCFVPNVSSPATPGLIRTSIYERLPPKRLSNSRFGGRLLGVLMSTYTFSVGAYQTYADIPQPKVHYLDVLGFPATQNTVPFPTTIVAEVTHGKETIIGGTLSFFQPLFLPGVIRSEVGYFLNEPAYVQVANQGIVPTVPQALNGLVPVLDTFVPKADYLRWVLGYDIFQLNIPWLSQTNNIILINQWFAELNLSGEARYRGILAANDPNQVLDQDQDEFSFGIPQPNGTQTVIPKFNSLGNDTFQAFLMHGLLVPQLTFVWSPQGWFSVLPNLTYRIRDDLLIKVGYSGIYGKFISGGFYRDRDQVGMRLTYLIS